MDKLASPIITCEQCPDGTWCASIFKGTQQEVKVYGWTHDEALEALRPAIKTLRFAPVGQMKRREAITA